VITRRIFLIGAGATGAATVAGGGAVAVTRQEGLRRFLHRHGVLSGPDKPIPDAGATVRYDVIASNAMGRIVGYGVSVPTGDVDAVLICLHGRGGTHRDPFVDIGIHQFVAAAGLHWVVAAVDGAESFWHRRADGTDAGRLVVDELLPLVSPHERPVPRLIIGWSMGGYGALLLGEQHPEVFTGVAASGPSIWRAVGEATAGAFDDADDFARNDVLALAPALANKVRVDCGEDDPFADASREFLRRVPGAGGGISPGFHESPTWRSVVPAQLDFLRATL
jgi:S-formylglutathione hydrolase FrmB